MKLAFFVQIAHSNKFPKTKQNKKWIKITIISALYVIYYEHSMKAKCTCVLYTFNIWIWRLDLQKICQYETWIFLGPLGYLSICQHLWYKTHKNESEKDVRFPGH